MYYTVNAVEFKVREGTSGRVKVKINGEEIEGKEGVYRKEIRQSGRYVIIVEDKLGNESKYEFYAYIDNVIPRIEVKAYDGEKEYVSGEETTNEIRFEVRATYGESGGRIECREDGREWEEVEEVYTVKTRGKIEFRAVSNSREGEGFLTSEIIEYEVEIKEEDREIEITAEWFIVEGEKEYDGTTYIDRSKITLNKKSPEVIANFEIWDKIEYTARYARAEASDRAEIEIEVWAKENSGIRIVNGVRGVYGRIERKKVRVTLNSGEKMYGESSADYDYTVEGVIDEIGELEFSTNASIDSVPDEEEYRYWLARREYGNYVVENYEEINSYEKGKALEIRKAVIKELANEREEFIGLDTESIQRLKIRFKDVIDGERYHELETSYLSKEDGAYLPTDNISEAGIYKIKLYMPKELESRYELSEELYEIRIKVKEVETTGKPDEGNTDGEETETPKDEEDRTDTDLESKEDGEIGETEEKKTRGYVEVAVVAAAAIGVAGVISIFKSLANKRRKKS